MTTNIVQSISDEVLAEIEKASLHAHCDVPGMVLAGLIARLKAAEVDAARYRWLRERAGVLPEGCETIWVLMDGFSMTDLERQETDQAIDAAMEKAK